MSGKQHNHRLQHVEALPPDSDPFVQIYTQIWGIDTIGAWVGPQSLLQLLLEYKISYVMEKLPEDQWTVEWGPTVWKNPSDLLLSGPDNVWMVTRNKALKFDDGTYDTIVVGIAGSAIFSKEDWEVYDFGIDKVVDFNAWTSLWEPGQTIPAPNTSSPGDPSIASVALGTCEGVRVLVNTPDGADSSRGTLIDYLQSVQSSMDRDSGPIRLVFAGHSLGGALAPALCMGLYNAKLIDAFNNSGGIKVVPAAGATPGDGTFSTNYYLHLPPDRKGTSDYQIFNADFYNHNDIVPQAWSTDDKADRNIDNITKKIYTDLPNDLKTSVEAAITNEKSRTQKSGIVYEPIEGQGFTGDPIPAINGYIALVESIIKQHGHEYAKQTGTLPIVQATYSAGEHIVAKHKDLKKKNLKQAMMDFPVLRFLVHKIPTDGLTSPNVHPYDVILTGN